MITRHFIDVAGADGAPRRVHYRRAGAGPALLMVHQSPRSSAEYTALIERWSAHFTCIAPDTPGFGQSAPLSGTPEIDDFADAVAALLDALGIARTAAYGFHSGGIILLAALRRHPQRLSAVAVGGYAIWTPAEMANFGEHYLPPFVPSAYGEHVTWLWNRILEQSWYFPWFDVRDAARLPGAHDDPVRVDAVVREMLDAGDAYRAGYGAVLRASRDVPPPDAVTPPVLITAYDGDPLQAHIDRLGPLPAHWTAHKVATAADHEAASFDFLRGHAADAAPALVEATDEGFAAVATSGFDGLIHWRARSAERTALWAHAPGEALELLPDDGDYVTMDMPGHGLSADWPGAAPVTWSPWGAILRATADALGCEKAGSVYRHYADPEREFPDLTPDRFGAYLIRAWSIVRARQLFGPWYAADAAHVLPIDAGRLAPDALARAHRALLRAPAARAYATAMNELEKPDGYS